MRKLISVVVRDSCGVVLSQVVEDKGDRNNISFESLKSVLEWLEVLKYAEVSWDDGEYPYQVFMNWS